MAVLTSKNEINILREAGRRLAFVLGEVLSLAKPGTNVRELDELAERLIRKGGDVPAFLNYTPVGARRPYPATLCVSTNNEVVHGIPNEKEKILKEGDIVGFDVGLIHEGLVVDMAKTVPVGRIDTEAKKLLQATEEALSQGIKEARAGKRIGDIGHVIQSRVEKEGFSIVCELGGHGVGRALHEDPFIPNFGIPGTGQELQKGMVLAIEPIVNEGSPNIVLDEDGYTYRTKDEKRSAHFEHTILITKHGQEIITVG